MADAYCRWCFRPHDHLDYSEHDDGRPRTPTFAESGATCAGFTEDRRRHVASTMADQEMMEWTLRLHVATGPPPSEIRRDADDSVFQRKRCGHRGGSRIRADSEVEVIFSWVSFLFFSLHHTA